MLSWVNWMNDSCRSSPGNGYNNYYPTPKPPPHPQTCYQANRKNNSNPTTTQQQQQPQPDKKPLTSVVPTHPAYTSKLPSLTRALTGSLNTTASIDIISTATKTNVCVFASAQDIRARALLCPLTGKGTPVSMHCRSLNIGTGETQFYLHWRKVIFT